MCSQTFSKIISPKIELTILQQSPLTVFLREWDISINISVKLKLNPGSMSSERVFAMKNFKLLEIVHLVLTSLPGWWLKLDEKCGLKPCCWNLPSKPENIAAVLKFRQSFSFCRVSSFARLMILVIHMFPGLFIAPWARETPTLWHQQIYFKHQNMGNICKYCFLLFSLLLLWRRTNSGKELHILWVLPVTFGKSRNLLQNGSQKKFKTVTKNLQDHSLKLRTTVQNQQ